MALAVLAACSGGSEPSTRGVLDIEVAGLPGGLAARVSVAGPRGYTADLTATTRLDDLPSGDYVVKARYVSAPPQVYTPAFLADTITIAARDTGLVQVAYAGGPAPSGNMVVSGYSIIQSTQRANNSIPMVGSRTALLRVFTTANAAGLQAPVARVRLYNGPAPVDSFDVTPGVAAVPTTVDTSSLAASWNLLIPAARVTAGLGFSVELDPEDAMPDAVEGDNRFPPAGSQPVIVQNVPAWVLRFVPVTQSVNGLTGNVSAANADTLIGFTRRLHPLGSVTVSVRPPFTTSAPAYTADDANGGWSQTLSEINALRTSEGSTRHYVGIINVTYGGGIAGLGYVGAAASISWDRATSAPEIIAHELGHNFGRIHAPCGNPGGPDPSYPSAYTNASIGTWGLDLPAMQLRSPAVYKDVMSYCNPDWISDYNYMAILNFRGSVPAVAAARPSGTGLLVWGRIRNGAVVLEPSFLVEAPASMPARPGAHRVEGLDAAGNRLFGFSFDGDLVPDLPEGEERHFAYVVPLSATERQRIAGLRLVGKGLTALRRPSVRTSGPRAATPGIVARKSGDLTAVRWNPGYPLAVIRDAASGEILGFARGGAGQVTARGRPLRVEISDGVTSLPGVTVVAP